MNSSKDECDCRPLSFELDPSQMRSLCLKSKLPSDLRGWTVELDRTEASACEVHLLPNASFMQISYHWRLVVLAIAIHIL